MNKFRWQIGLLVVALIVVAILLLGQQPILGAFSSQPAEGGLYIEALIGSMVRLNPLLDYNNPVDQDVNALIYSSLIRFDERGNPGPDLAEEWGLSLDGLTYNLRLREDAFWHDGESFTAKDVIFTTNLLGHADAPIPDDIREFWQSVEVIAFDDYNIQFRLSEAFAPFLDYLSFGMLPEHILGNTHPRDLADSPFNSAPIGTGPYVLNEILIEAGQISGVILDANSNYYLEGPFIDQFIFRYFNNANDAYQAYLDGEVLGLSKVEDGILADVLADQSLNVFSSRMPQLSIVLLNLENSSLPFFQDIDLRKALMLGINRQWMVDEFLNGQAYVADGPILPGTWAYNPSMTTYSFDLNQAITLLKNAGYSIPSEGGLIRSKDGLALSFDFMYPNTDLHRKIAENIQSTWAQMGVSIKLIGLDYDILLSTYLEPRNYDAALIDLSLANSPDPDPYPFWHQAEANSGQNYSRWNDRRASEYLEQARVSISLTQRIRLYTNFQTHFSRELPALPLYFPIYNYALSVQVQGVNVGPLFSPSDRFAHVNEWFFVARGSLDLSQIEANE